MFEFLNRKEEDLLLEPITTTLQSMREYGPDSPEYEKLLNHLNSLYEIRRKSRRPRVSPDTMAKVAANLAGILTIVAYEQSHVMTSKAMSHLMRGD